MRKAWPVLLLVFALIALLYSVQCTKESSQAEESVYLNHSDSVGYVGMSTCAQCHSDKVNSFIHTGMGSSFDLATKKKSSAVFGYNHFVYDSVLDFYYYPFWQDSSLYIKEFRLAGGDTVFSRSEKIDYIIGSGHHTNSHLVRKNNYLVQAPITFYSQKGEWNLAPGFENGNNSRFTRVIDDECMGCHNSLAEYGTNSRRSFIKVGNGIDCERCHGPGELHVNFRRNGGSAEPLSDLTIVNPRALNWERQIDLCQRCHLQGNNVLKPGKSFSDFKPGQKLSDVFEVYLPTYEDESTLFNMANHSERLQSSKCFIKSGKNDNQKFTPKLTCITCHNPHVSVRTTNNTFFNKACMDCHQTESCSEIPTKREELSDNCVTCHMPPSSTEDIPHVTVHEHKIGIYPDGIQLKTQDPIGLKCVNNKNPETFMKIQAYLTYFEKFNTNPIYRKKARQLLDSYDFPRGELHYAFQVQNWSEAIRVVPKLELAELSSVDCYRVAESYNALEQLKEANNWFELACQKGPDYFEYWTRWGGMLIRSGEISEARDKLEKALELFPEYKPALNNWVLLEIASSRFASAEKALRKCLDLDPDYLPVLKNAIQLYSVKGNRSETLKYIERVLHVEPENNQVRELLKEYRN